MKTLFRLSQLFLFFVCINKNSFAQYDTLFFHNGKIEPVTVLRVSVSGVSFKYKNEDAERNMSKLAIQKIIYRSGRVEYPSVKQEVPEDSSWNKVVVISDFVQTEGLVKAEEISSHTAFINLHTSSSGEKAARKKLFKKAIAVNCPFVFITENKETLYGTIKFWGVSQHRFKAIAYHY